MRRRNTLVQNSARWTQTTAEGFGVRVQFLPGSAAEVDRIKMLLKNFKIVVGVVADEGPLTVDLFFTDTGVTPGEDRHAE